MTSGHEAPTFAGIIELDVVMKDESGAQIGAGRASVTGAASNDEARRAARAIAN